MIGMGIANVVGPMWLSDGKTSVHDFNKTGISVSEVREEIALYTSTQAILFTIILVAMIMYFPSAPKVRAGCHVPTYCS